MSEYVPSEKEVAENKEWLERHGGPILPPGLWEGGTWIPAIRDVVRKELATAAYVQVLKQPPSFLRWILKPWLRFQAPKPIE